MLTELCKSRLRKVSKKILENPARIYMYDWILESEAAKKRRLIVPPCGTVACIAGWVVLTNTSRVRRFFYRAEPRIEAPILLGITQSQAYRLFYISGWPQELAGKAGRAVEQSRELAEIVSKRIELFIETEGGV